MTKLEMLYLDVWRKLSVDQQKIVFQDVLNRFINSDTEIQDVKVVEHLFKNERFKIWEAVIDGLRYVLIPGKKKFKITYDWDLFLKRNKMLFCVDDKPNKIYQKNYDKFMEVARQYTFFQKSDAPSLKIDPMLISISALPVDGIPVGYYNLYDGKKIINSSLEKKYQDELALLYKNRTETPHFFMRENGIEPEAEVFKKSFLRPDKLRAYFFRQNVDFISSDEYYYVKSGGENTFFPWGDYLEPTILDQLYYIPNRFGIKIERNDDKYLVTDNQFRYMDGPVKTEMKIAQYIKFASFFDGGFVADVDYFDKPINQWQMEYRPVIRLK